VDADFKCCLYHNTTSVISHMNKLVLICLLFVVPIAYSQGTTTNPDCANPLLTVLDLDKLDAPTAQSDLSFCKGLEDAKLCCSAATINSFQAPIDALIRSIIVKAAARDTWLLTLRNDATNGLSSFKANLASVQTSAKAALAIINGANGLGASTKPTGTDKDRLVDLEEAVLPFTTLSDTVNNGVDDNWDSYQTTRKTCIEALVEAQASVLCLACTSNYNSIGVDTSASTDPIVLWAPAFVTSISGKCQPFLVQAQTQNALVTAYTYRKVLAALNTNLGKVDATSIKTDTVATVFTGVTAETLTTDSQEPLAALTSCTNSDCALAYTGMWTKHATLNDDYAANGGAITVSDSSSRLLSESRTLTASSGTYDPSSAANSAGVTVEFPEDAIAAASGFRQGGLMTCLVALIAAFLF